MEALETRCEELQRHLEEAETRMQDRKEKRRSFLLIDQETEDGNCSVRNKNKHCEILVSCSDDERDCMQAYVTAYKLK